MFWRRRTVSVRLETDLLSRLAGDPLAPITRRSVSNLLRAHLECEEKVEALATALEGARREARAAKAHSEELRTRVQELQEGRRELLAECRRLEERVQSLHRRRTDPREDDRRRREGYVSRSSGKGAGAA